MDTLQLIYTENDKFRHENTKWLLYFTRGSILCQHTAEPARTRCVKITACFGKIWASGVSHTILLWHVSLEIATVV
jgi:hypothetical protein